MRLFEQVAVAFLATSTAVAWETQQMSEKLRKELCAEQVLFCTNVCGGETFTREAFCNVNTLGAKCACANGAESTVRRYQWPVFQRVCEAQHTECRLACDQSNKIVGSDKAFCFNSCDSSFSCSTENAPGLKVMVDKFDDPTTGSPKKPASPPQKPKGGDADIKVSVNSKDKAKKLDGKGNGNGSGSGEPKRRGGPLSPNQGSANSGISAHALSASMLGFIVVMSGMV